MSFQIDALTVFSSHRLRVLAVFVRLGLPGHLRLALLGHRWPGLRTLAAVVAVFVVVAVDPEAQVAVAVAVAARVAHDDGGGTTRCCCRTLLLAQRRQARVA